MDVAINGQHEGSLGGDGNVLFHDCIIDNILDVMYDSLTRYH